MDKIYNNIKTHWPMWAAGALVALNALIDSNTITVNPRLAALISWILAASGIGVLHYRANKNN